MRRGCLVISQLGKKIFLIECSWHWKIFLYPEHDSRVVVFLSCSITGTVTWSDVRVLQNCLSHREHHSLDVTSWAPSHLKLTLTGAGPHFPFSGKMQAIRHLSKYLKVKTQPVEWSSFYPPYLDKYIHNKQNWKDCVKLWFL